MMTPQKLFSDALERVQLDPAIASLPPIEQALKAAALLLMESPTDVFAKAAAQMNEAFPPRVHTATQDRADLERLYPKGSDGKSSASNADEEIDMTTVLEQSFAASQGVITLSASMTDDQILALIKGGCTWSKGKAFQVIPPQAE